MKKGVKVLLVVDMLNDFVKKDGLLCVKGADTIVEKTDDLVGVFDVNDDKVFFLNDSHDVDDAEFKSWPKHCVEGTAGAKVVDGIDVKLSKGNGMIIAKRTLSGFSNPDLKKYLNKLDSENEPGLKCDIYVCGVATEYCVRATVIDALNLKYNVFVVVDAIKGVDLKPGDINKALLEMGAEGAKAIYADDITVEND